jgi:hypothetical protein
MRTPFRRRSRVLFPSNWTKEDYSKYRLHANRYETIFVFDELTRGQSGQPLRIATGHGIG